MDEGAILPDWVCSSAAPLRERKKQRRRLYACAVWEVIGLENVKWSLLRRRWQLLAWRRRCCGFFLGALIDLDGAFEVGAVFDHDARGGQIAITEPSFLISMRSLARRFPFTLP